MVTNIGNAITGYATGGPVDLPRPTMSRTTHRPWCVDCKRKHDATDLDAAGRCSSCARAAASRAKAAEAREARAAEIAALEAKHQAEAGKKAKAEKRPAPAPLPKKKAAPTAASPSGPASTAARPAPVPVQPRAVPRTAVPVPSQPDLGPLITAAIDALDALRTALTQTPAAAAPSPVLAAAGPAVPEAPSPVSGPAPQTPAAGTGKGKPTRQPATHSRCGPVVDETAVVDDYEAGETRPTIAASHGITTARVTRILHRRGVELRDDRTGHSGGRNRVILAPDKVAEVKAMYLEQQASLADVAAHAGIDRRTVCRVLTDAGVEIRPGAHLNGTVITDDMATAIATHYAAGTSIKELCDQYRLASHRVRAVITDAGQAIRPKGSATAKAERIAALGTTAHDIKAWAVKTGRIDRATTGLVATSLIDAWEQAHHTSSTTNTTGATA